MNLTTYAVVGDGDELYLTLINKEHDLHAKGAEVSVVVPREYHSVELMRMEQAAANVAPSDVRLGGAAMQVNGPGTACGDKIGGSTVLIPEVPRPFSGLQRKRRGRRFANLPELIPSRSRKGKRKAH